MSKINRPMFAPTTPFMNMLYTICALIGPRALIEMYYNDGFDVSWFIMCSWYFVTILYTLDWAIASYRKWKFPKKEVVSPPTSAYNS